MKLLAREQHNLIYLIFLLFYLQHKNLLVNGERNNMNINLEKSESTVNEIFIDYIKLDQVSKINSSSLAVIVINQNQQNQNNKILLDSKIEKLKNISLNLIANEMENENSIQNENLLRSFVFKRKRKRRNTITTNDVDDDDDDDINILNNKQISTTINSKLSKINDYIDNDENAGIINKNLFFQDMNNINNNNSLFMDLNDNLVDTFLSSTIESTACTSEQSVNCTNNTMSCDDDTVPCNATYEEYMQYIYDYVYPRTSEWILIASHCVVFLTGLVGNALVCIAVYTNYSMRTVTNVFIVNLAVADFFVIFICLPPTVVWDVTETWFLGESMCKIVLYFQTVSVTVSVLTLTFISVDRWYAICFPLRYRTKITRAIASVAFIWTIALLSAFPEFLALTLKKMELRYESVLFTQCVTNWPFETEKNFYIVRLFTLYVFPLFLMIIAYFQIVRVLWRSETIPGHRESRNHHHYTYARGSQMPASANTSTMGQLRARRKAAKMLVAVVIMFAVCYFPVHAFNILRYTNNLPHNEITSIFSLLSHWLCYANSAINPIIYNFMSGKFRREFHNALEKCRCARPKVEDRSLNHSTPASRLNNVSPSTRSNYQLTSVRDITRDLTRQQTMQTMQTTFAENCVNNGHSASIPMLNSKKEQIP